METEAGYVVGVTMDQRKGHEPVLIVGRQRGKRMDVVNTITGEEAVKLYKLLVGEAESKTLIHEG